jgi:hypothetical protein
LAAQIERTEAALQDSGSSHALAMCKRLREARIAFLDAVDFVVSRSKTDPNAVFAGSVPYLMLTGNLMAGWQMARGLLVAQSRLAEGVDGEFMASKIATARVYADHLLSRVPGLRDSIVEGSEGVTSMALEAF